MKSAYLVEPWRWSWWCWRWRRGVGMFYDGDKRGDFWPHQPSNCPSFTIYFSLSRSPLGLKTENKTLALLSWVSLHCFCPYLCYPHHHYYPPSSISPSLSFSLPPSLSLSLPLFALVVRHVRGIPGHSCHVKECSQTTEDGSLFFYLFIYIYLFIFSPQPLIVNILTCITRCLHWTTRLARRWTWRCALTHARTHIHPLTSLSLSLSFYICVRKKKRKEEKKNWSAVAQHADTRDSQAGRSPPPPTPTPPTHTYTRTHARTHLIISIHLHERFFRKKKKMKGEDRRGAAAQLCKVARKNLPFDSSTRIKPANAFRKRGQPMMEFWLIFCLFLQPDASVFLLYGSVAGDLSLSLSIYIYTYIY